jgi:hypothetical protein
LQQQFLGVAIPWSGFERVEYVRFGSGIARGVEQFRQSEMEFGRVVGFHLQERFESRDRFRALVQMLGGGLVAFAGAAG